MHRLAIGIGVARTLLQLFQKSLQKEKKHIMLRYLDLAWRLSVIVFMVLTIYKEQLLHNQLISMKEVISLQTQIIEKLTKEKLHEK